MYVFASYFRFLLFFHSIKCESNYLRKKQKSKWNENEIRYEFGEIGNKRRTIKNEKS